MRLTTIINCVIFIRIFNASLALISNAKINDKIILIISEINDIGGIR